MLLKCFKISSTNYWYTIAKLKKKIYIFTEKKINKNVTVFFKLYKFKALKLLSICVVRSTAESALCYCLMPWDRQK